MIWVLGLYQKYKVKNSFKITNRVSLDPSPDSYYTRRNLYFNCMLINGVNEMFAHASQHGLTLLKNFNSMPIHLTYLYCDLLYSDSPLSVNDNRIQYHLSANYTLELLFLIKDYLKNTFCICARSHVLRFLVILRRCIPWREIFISWFYAISMSFLLPCSEEAGWSCKEWFESWRRQTGSWSRGYKRSISQ